jgi:hypothetical protein
MPGITLEDAETHLAAWLAADLAVSNGQAYQIGSRMLTRANAALIDDKIEKWEARVHKLSRGGRISLRGLNPIDVR